MAAISTKENEMCLVAPATDGHERQRGAFFPAEFPPEDFAIFVIANHVNVCFQNALFCEGVQTFFNSEIVVDRYIS